MIAAILGCFLYLFYIKPQPVPPPSCLSSSCFLYLFYIKPQPCRRQVRHCFGCFLYLFYIKPQHNPMDLLHGNRCFLYLFYIKPQPYDDRGESRYGCFLYLFYIKPQPYACISSDYQRYISEISLQKQRKWLEIICQRSKKVPIALDRPAILSEPCLGSSGYSRTVCR